MKNTKANEKDARNVIDGANELASVMYDFFVKHDKYNKHTFAVIGYATEIMLSFCADATDVDHDKISRDYREYMGVVHEDVKKMLKPNMNLN